MLVNFCHWSMSPSVTSDRVCNDDFPTKNLIAQTHPMARYQGFMTESFVKPPVKVVFQFPCNIIISKIIVDPCIGSQKTKKLELFTDTRCVQSSWLIHDSSNIKSQQFQNSSNKIGSISMPDPGVVCFENPKFYASPPFTKDICSSAGEVKHRSNLGSRSPRSLNCVSSLTLRLLQAGQTGVLALKMVEVWGQPSMSNDTSVFPVCLNRFLQAVFPPLAPPGTPSDTLSSMEQAPRVGTQVDESELPEIPEDFQDALTCEMMAIPMLLPSGKNVDLCTLDKHREVETAKGRLASDPFTGLIYTHERKPVPNNCLKARIDAFLTKYSLSKNVKSVARTVQTLPHSSAIWRPGGKRTSAWTEPASERKKSRLVIDWDRHASTNEPANASQSNGSSQNRSQGLGNATGPCQARLTSHATGMSSRVAEAKPYWSKGDNSKLCAEATSATPWSKGSNSFSADNLMPRPTCPENFLSSLSVKPSTTFKFPKSADIVAAALKNLPSYTGRKSEAAPTASSKLKTGEMESDNSVCSDCGASDSDGLTNLYQLPCDHIICRQCVLSKGLQRLGDGAVGTRQCGQCGGEYPSTAIHRIH